MKNFLPGHRQQWLLQLDNRVLISCVLTNLEAIAHRVHVVLAHSLYKVRCANNVVSVIEHRAPDRLANCLFASKVYYSMKSAQ